MTDIRGQDEFLTREEIDALMAPDEEVHTSNSEQNRIADILLGVKEIRSNLPLFQREGIDLKKDILGTLDEKGITYIHRDKGDHIIVDTPFFNIKISGNMNICVFEKSGKHHDGLSLSRLKNYIQSIRW